MKKTNVHNPNVLQITSYPGLGVYENTDEAGNVMIVMPIPATGMVWMYNRSDFDHIVSAIDKMNTEEAMLVSDPLTLIPDKENMVSEDFTLKLMALVVNKEKIKEVK